MGLSVCLCVCLSVKSHLTYGASVCPENAVMYSAGNEGRKICGDLPETTAFKSYAAKHERNIVHTTMAVMLLMGAAAHYLNQLVYKSCCFCTIPVIQCMVVTAFKCIHMQ